MGLLDTFTAVSAIAKNISPFFNSGGGSSSSQGSVYQPIRTKDLRKQNAYSMKLARQQKALAFKWMPREYQRMYSSIVKGAQGAGMHPLFAMGAQPIQQSMPVVLGQPMTGSIAGDKTEEMMDYGAMADGVMQGVKKLIGPSKEEQYQLDKAAYDAEHARVMEMQLRAKEMRRVDAETDLVREQILSSQVKRSSQKANQRIDKYIDIFNNLTGEMEKHPNPALGIEFPEAYGAALLGRATQRDLQKKQGQPVPDTYGP